MPLRISYGFPNPGVENRGKFRTSSRLASILRILYILYSLEVGFFLILFPWLEIWENNYVLYCYPGLRPFVINPFLKGAVLGLGIVNLLIGFQEIAHFRKGPNDYFPR